MYSKLLLLIMIILFLFYGFYILSEANYPFILIKVSIKSHHPKFTIFEALSVIVKFQNNKKI
jgi:hypothetical protein